jgi:hypothetical protein
MFYGFSTGACFRLCMLFITSKRVSKSWLSNKKKPSDSIIQRFLVASVMSLDPRCGWRRRHRRRRRAQRLQL